MAGRGAAADVTGEGRGSRGRPRDPQVDTAILDAALELLIERGFDETSIEQIAKRAGVARLTVYRRWAGKEDIFVDAIDRSRAPAATSPELIATGSVADLLDAFAETATREDAHLLLTRLIGTSRDRPGLMAVYWERYVRARRAALTAVLERARERGELPVDHDVDVLQDILGGALFYRMLEPSADMTAGGLRAYLGTVMRHAGYTGPL